MKGRMNLTLVMLTTAALVVVAAIDTVNFDQGTIGQPPAGWTATKTGSGDAKWTIEKDDTAPSKPNVLKQSGTATYPLCFKNDTSLQDGFVEMKIKPAESPGASRMQTTTTSLAPTRSKITSRSTTPSTAGALRRSA
jgi:hypothetical protein